MSKVIDEKVVSMQFDNRQFERNVSSTMSTLDKLKQKLHLTGATKGLSEVAKASNKIDMSVLGNAVQTVHAKFSALEVIGVTALANIANQAVNAGKRMSSALTIDPIKTGFKEYETQIGSIQTILANTQSKGSTLQDVNKALAELNTYADKTIYNFTEMTRNIGTFTAAGVELDTSVSSIKGIANLAAVSGSTSYQASSAMYQLSQALAAGRVSLMDWNSVVNAGMGGELFQNALKRTAKQMGKNVDAAIEKYGSFRESLTQGEWLTTEVLTETLTQLSGAYTKADLIAKGYTESQAEEIAKLAETAVSAATEVKTFTQLWDTLKEAAQSGWTQTWQILVGDFGEAKELLTSISNVMGGIIGKKADARNSLLSSGLSTGWKQLMSKGINDEDLFKNTLKKVAKDQGVEIDKLITNAGSFEKSLKKGWVTGEMLTESISIMTKKVSGLSVAQLKEAGYTSEQVESLKKLNEEVQNGTLKIDDFAKKMSIDSGRQNIIQGLTNVFKELSKVVAPIKESLHNIFPPMTGDQLYKLTEGFEKLTEKFKVTEETVDKIRRTFTGVFSAFDLLRKGINLLLSPLMKFSTTGGASSIVGIFLEITASIGDFFTMLNENAGVNDLFNGILSGLSKAAQGLVTILKAITDGVGNLGGAVSIIGDIIGSIASTIGDGIKWIAEALSMGDIMTGLAGGGIFYIANKLGGLLGTIDDAIANFFTNTKDKVSMFKEISDLLDSLKESIQAFTAGIRTTTLLLIAAAITMLTLSLKELSKIKGTDITKGLFAIGSMMAGLNLSFASITKSLSKYTTGGTIRAGLFMIGMATAIKILTNSLLKFNKINTQNLIEGLVSINIMMMVLRKTILKLNGVKLSLKTSVAIIALAEACSILSEALVTFGKMSWDEIARGLTAMGGALAELVIAMSVLNKHGGLNSVLGSASIVIAVESLDEISETLKKIGSLSWEEIGKGLAGMGGALAELSISVGALGKLAGFSGILGGSAIVVAVESLDEISETLKNIGKLSWKKIGKGLTAMGGALTELGVVVGLLGKLSGLSGILGGTTITIAAESLDEISSALKNIGKLSWEKIKKGLVGMGGALTELGVVVGLLGKLTGFSGILGGAALTTAVESLDEISSALKNIGKLSWEKIKKGLSGMGGALTELGVVVGLLGKLAGFSGILGGTALTIAAESLDEISETLKKIGSLSWEEIGKGLVGMGGAMAEVGAITGATGSIAGFAGWVGGGTLNIAVQALDELAAALQKFGSMSWDEIGRGLAAMGGALGETALGGVLNTFSLLGSYSIDKVAAPLGTLADSVKKWVGVEVPEGLALQLGSLANGIFSFTFDGLGAGAIAKVAAPLGILADSVIKWVGMTVPEDLSSNLKAVADGVGKFSFKSLGGIGISASAEPLGKLAESVSKWTSVKVPEDFGTTLTTLSDAIKTFTLAFAGGWSMDVVAKPLGELAKSVAAWKEVTIPKDIETGLIALSSGIKSFTWAFAGGFNIGNAVTPLTNLAGAIKEWDGLNFTSDFGAALTSLAKGLTDISTFTQTEVKEGTYTSISNAVKSIAEAAKDILTVDLATPSAKISEFAESLNKMEISADSFTNLGNNMINNLVNSINSGVERLKLAASLLSINTTMTFVTSMNKTLSDNTELGAELVNKTAAKFTESGKKIASNITTGFNQKIPEFTKAVKSMSTTVSKTLTAMSKLFSNAGLYAAIGFAAGLRSGIFAVKIAATAMANAASEAARKALDEHSPSKVFYGIGDFAGKGFTNALNDARPFARKAGDRLAESARLGVSNAISKIADAVNNGVNTQPTIRPVVDLSDVTNSARSINNALNLNPTVGIAARTSRLMNSRIQNGTNNDVISAINELKSLLGNISNNNITIGGITYDDGSNIAETVKALVRAAKVERRV